MIMSVLKRHKKFKYPKKKKMTNRLSFINTNLYSGIYTTGEIRD